MPDTVSSDGVKKRRRGYHVCKYYVRDLTKGVSRNNTGCHEFESIEDAADFCGVSVGSAKSHLSKQSRFTLNGTFVIRSELAGLFDDEEEFVIPFDRVRFSVSDGANIDLANLRSIIDVRHVLGLGGNSTLFTRFLCEAASETPNRPVTLRAPDGRDITVTVVTPKVASYSAVARIWRNHWRRGVKSTQLDGIETRYSYAAFAVLTEWVARNPSPTPAEAAQFLADNRPWFEGRQTGSWNILNQKITVITCDSSEEDLDDV